MLIFINTFSTGWRWKDFWYLSPEGLEATEAWPEAPPWARTLTLKKENFLIYFHKRTWQLSLLHAFSPVSCFSVHITLWHGQLHNAINSIVLLSTCIGAPRTNGSKTLLNQPRLLLCCLYRRPRNRAERWPRSGLPDAVDWGEWIHRYACSNRLL